MRRSKHIGISLPWALAMAVPLIVIFSYSVGWIFLKPRTTDIDRIAFIGACVVLCLLLAGSHEIRRQRIAIDRRRAGQCLRCGYDLRATPGRCPECGTVATREE